MRSLRNGVLVVAALACVAAQAASGGTPFVSGSYRDASGQPLYVATDVEDDEPIINWLNPDTGEYGVTSRAPADWHLQNTVSEKRFSVQAPEGALGVSLFERCVGLGWLSVPDADRSCQLTPAGRDGFARLGVDGRGPQRPAPPHAPVVGMRSPGHRRLRPFPPPGSRA